MPRELAAIAPRQAVLRAYEPPPLGPNMVRVVSEFGSPKHGTELSHFRGKAAAMLGRYDREWRCFFDDQPAVTFPWALGNMIVGRVDAVGESVTALAPGDRVYGHLRLRDVDVVDAARLRPVPPGLSPEAAVCLDPADAALAMRDAHVRVGDRVAVFGLGAIGLMALQLSKLSGALWVIAVDPVAHRRDLAVELGADVALDPTEGDVGLEIRRLTDKLGVDVALEVSGRSRALHQAIRATRFEGTVGVISAHDTGAEHLVLGQEFHWNAVHLVSCRTVSLPLRDYGWDHDRIVDLAETLLASGKLSARGVIQPVVPFAESAAAYQEIEAHPESCVKLGVRF